MWFVDWVLSPPPSVEICGIYACSLRYFSLGEDFSRVKILVLTLPNGFKYERDLGPEIFEEFSNLERVIFLEGRQWPGPAIPGITFESSHEKDEWDKINLMLRLIEELE